MSMSQFNIFLPRSSILGAYGDMLRNVSDKIAYIAFFHLSYDAPSVWYYSYECCV